MLTENIRDHSVGRFHIFLSGILNSNEKCESKIVTVAISTLAALILEILNLIAKR